MEKLGTVGIIWVNKYRRLASLKNNKENAKGFANAIDGTLKINHGDDDACDCDFEVLTFNSDDENIACPKCGISDVKRQLSVSCIGGSGFDGCTNSGGGGFS